MLEGKSQANATGIVQQALQVLAEQWNPWHSFCLHTTFNRLIHLASKPKNGLINMSDVDWTTSKSNFSISTSHAKA